MYLILTVQHSRVTISLKEGDGVFDEISWDDRRDLLEKLLPNIDALLGRNALKITDIGKFSLDIDVPESYSTYRIAKATIETLRFYSGNIVPGIQTGYNIQR